MDFALDAQRRAFADSVRGLLAARFPDAARAAYDNPDGDGHPDKLWTAAAELGWLAVTVPPEHGGLGLGLVDAQLVARALGAAAAPGPWLTSTIAAEAIRLAGDDAQQASWLPGLAAGRLVGTQVLDHHPCLDANTARARLTRVEYAAIADLLVVADPDGRLAVVDLAAPGVRVTRQRQYDHGTRLARVELDSAPVTALARAGAAVVADLRRRAATLAAADLVGVAREALTRTVDYDKQRVRFGRPVGSFRRSNISSPTYTSR